MAQTYQTIVYFPPGGASVEMQLSDWKVTAEYRRERQNKGKNDVLFTTQEDFDAPGGTQFVYKAQAQFWWGRTSKDGTPGSFSGGSLWFQGYFDEPRQRMDGNRRYVDYVLHSVWWLFERNMFKQHRKVFAGYPNHDASQPPILNDIVMPEVYLGETVTEVRQTNGQQINEIIAWMNESYNPTKRGAVNGRDDSQDIVEAGVIEPHVYMAVNRVQSAFSAECIASVLRWTPDAVVIVDTTTVPPTLSVRTVGKWNLALQPPVFIDYTNLPEMEVDITAEQERSILLAGQQNRKVNGVIIYYRIAQEIDGVTSVQFPEDRFPLNVGDFDPEVVSHHVELAGYKLSLVRALVQGEAIADLLGASQADQVAWWLEQDRTLKDEKIDPASIVVGAPAVVDKDGNAIDTTAYPYVLAGTLPTWLNGQVVEGTVTTDVAFRRYADATRLVLHADVVTRKVHQGVKLTNIKPQLYSAVSAFDNGEVPPVGVAESVYRSAAIDQWAGQITFVKGQLRQDLSLGMRLKLVGPNTTFSNVIPQSISERPHYGETTVVYGPMAPLDVDYFLEIARATRLRIIYNMPSGRSTGQAAGGSGGQVDTGADAEARNTAHAVEQSSLQGVLWVES